jgi:hypothetical protein
MICLSDYHDCMYSHVAASQTRFTIGNPQSTHEIRRFLIDRSQSALRPERVESVVPGNEACPSEKEWRSSSIERKCQKPRVFVGCKANAQIRSKHWIGYS